MIRQTRQEAISKFQRTLDLIERDHFCEDGVYQLAAVLRGDKIGIVDLILWHAQQAGVFHDEDALLIAAWWREEATSGIYGDSVESMKFVIDEFEDGTDHHIDLARRLFNAWKVNHDMQLIPA